MAIERMDPISYKQWKIVFGTKVKSFFRRSRGFGFITFSDPASVEKVLSFSVHQLDGKNVEPKVAVPRKTNPKLVMRTKKIFVGGEHLISEKTLEFYAVLENVWSSLLNISFQPNYNSTSTFK